MIITSTIGCLQHKFLLFKVTCKKTVVHHTDYTGGSMCSITTSIWNKIQIFGWCLSARFYYSSLTLSNLFDITNSKKQKYFNLKSCITWKNPTSVGPRLVYTFCVA